MFIDNFFKMQVPVFTMIFTVLGLIGGIWTAIKKTM
jgi:F0F1-type ATP synthase assembly protein I